MVVPIVMLFLACMGIFVIFAMIFQKILSRLSYWSCFSKESFPWFFEHVLACCYIGHVVSTKVISR